MTTQEDVVQSLSTSPDDGHTIATQAESEHVWPSHLTVPIAAGASLPAEPMQYAPKGKEKATKGPLRLLDLPVDILKEIIHQVRAA